MGRDINITYTIKFRPECVQDWKTKGMTPDHLCKMLHACFPLDVYKPNKIIVHNVPQGPLGSLGFEPQGELIDFEDIRLIFTKLAAKATVLKYLQAKFKSSIQDVIYGAGLGDEEKGYFDKFITPDIPDAPPPTEAGSSGKAKRKSPDVVETFHKPSWKKIRNTFDSDSDDD